MCKEIMTKEQALKELALTSELRTVLLEPLGIAFETFLGFAQLDRKNQKLLVRGVSGGRKVNK